MKKIVEHPEQIRLNGFAESNGVGFLPSKKEGILIVQTPGFFASPDGRNHLKTKYINPDIRDKNSEDKDVLKTEQKLKKYTKVFAIIIAVLALACMVLSFVSVKWEDSNLWTDLFATAMFVLLAMICLAKPCVIAILKFFGNKEIRSFSKFLAAKNSIENAYYDLGKVPTIEEAKQYSTRSLKCPYTRYGHFALICLFIGIIRNLDGIFYWIVAVAAIALVWVLEEKNHLTFWQKPILSNPDTKHYQVAIKALEESLKVIGHVHIGYKEINFETDGLAGENCNMCEKYDFCKQLNQERKGMNAQSHDENGDNIPADKAVDKDVKEGLNHDQK